MAVDRLRADIERQQERLEGHERRIGHLEVEEDRTRERLHRIEGDRQAMQKLVDTTKALAEQTRTLAQQVNAGVEQLEQLAESAAEKVLQKAAAQRSENRWKKAAWVAAHLTGIGSFGSLITLLILHHT